MCRGMDLDEMCAYTTTRKVAIRDRYLGLTYAVAQIAIVLYVVVYQIILLQAYNEKGSITGFTRMSLRRPAPAYRWNGAAPYCAGVTSADSDGYSIPSPGTYQYTPTDPTITPITQTQATCLYLDNKYAVPIDSEVNALFLPTRVTITEEAVGPLPECNTLVNSTCEWAATSTELAYVADPSLFTLLIDHSFASNIGFSANVRNMEGKLLDGDNTADLCASYSDFPAGCPNYVTIGGGGNPSILSMKSLLDAAGIESLDQAAADSGTLAAETYRYAGMVMIIDIQYSNYYLPGGGIKVGTGSFNPNEVVFAYKVSVVPDQDYKTEVAITPDSDRYAPTRTNYNQHGIRIIVTQSGRIGMFNFQALLINLTVSLGLLGVALVVTDFLAFTVCPARSIYKQYRLRKSVDMSSLRDTGKMPAILSQFRGGEELVDPMPEVFQKAFDDHGRELAERQRMLDKAAAPSQPKTIPEEPRAPIPTPVGAGIQLKGFGMSVTVPSNMNVAVPMDLSNVNVQVAGLPLSGRGVGPHVNLQPVGVPTFMSPKK